MHIHGTIPFNVPSYPPAKPTSDTSSSTPVYSTTAVAMAYGYSSSSNSSGSHYNGQTTGTSPETQSDNATDSFAATYDAPTTVSGQYNSNAALTDPISTIGSLIDKFA